MTIEEFEKSKKELLKEKEQNNNQISINDERTRMSKVNSFENKAITALGLSIFGYLPIFLASSALIENIGVTAFTNIIPALSYPVIVIGSSFSVGTLISSLINKKFNTKERYKSFSTAKTEIEKLEEEIHYQIELEKANNRNKAIDETLKVLESNQAILNKMSSRYDLNDKTAPQTKEEAETKANELSNIINDQYNKLDILTTQKVLHDNFWRIRSKYQKGTDILIATMMAGMLTMFFTGFPLMMVKDAITYSSFASLASIFSPFVIGVIGDGGYMIKRNKDHMKVFNNLNSQLGENALEEVYKHFEGAYEEQQKLTRLIETQIRDISLAEVQLQEIKRSLDTFMTEEDKKKEILFKDFPPLHITEETRQAIVDRPELHSKLSVRAGMGRIYTDEEWEQRREEVLSKPLLGGKEKGPTLVKKRIPPKHK